MSIFSPFLESILNSFKPIISSPPISIPITTPPSVIVPTMPHIENTILPTLLKIEYVLEWVLVVVSIVFIILLIGLIIYTIYDHYKFRAIPSIINEIKHEDKMEIENKPFKFYEKIFRKEPKDSLQTKVGVDKEIFDYINGEYIDIAQKVFHIGPDSKLRIIINPNMRTIKLGNQTTNKKFLFIAIKDQLLDYIRDSIPLETTDESSYYLMNPASSLKLLDNIAID